MVGTMKKFLQALFLSFVIVFGVSLAHAGEGPDQPTNIQCHLSDGTTCPVVLTGSSLADLNHVTFTWDTTLSSDSMIQITSAYATAGGGCAINPSADFAKNWYDSTHVTHHSIVVPIAPSPSSVVCNQYTYTAVSNSGTFTGNPPRGTPTASSAPWPSTPAFFVAPYIQVAGTPVYSMNIFGGGGYNIYQGAGANLGTNIDLVSGQFTSNEIMATIQASVDGQTCNTGSPTNLQGSSCGSTGVVFRTICVGGYEIVNPNTNNYEVHRFSTGALSGEYFCPSHFVGQPGLQFRIVPSTGTTLGNHVLTVQTQTVNSSSQALIGSPQSGSWTFNVQAVPTFTVVAPTVFPAVPDYNQYVANIATIVAGKCNMWNTAFANGVFFNDSASATQTAFDPWSWFNYDGNRVSLQSGDLMATFIAAGGSWASGHVYFIGDHIVVSGFPQIVTTAGTSGGSTPAFSSTPGTTISETGSTVQWTNGGNKTYWNACADNIGLQYLDWAEVVARYGVDAEWNRFMWGPFMNFYSRQGDVLNENCNGPSTCTGLSAQAAERGTANILVSGLNPQVFTQSYYINPIGTLRNLPYSINTLLVNWLQSGVKPTLDLNARVDMMLQVDDGIINYDPFAPNACCWQAPNFDIGLQVEDYESIYDVEHYLTPGQEDTRIPAAVKGILTWFNAKQYNLTGTDFTYSYQPWTQVLGNLSVEVGLNNLIANGYAWLQAITGDTCTINGRGCWAISDEMFEHAWDGYPNDQTAKYANQVMQDFSNIVGWRTNQFPGTDEYQLPTHNARETSHPDVVGPFNAQSYPPGYPQCNTGTLTSTGCTIQWYTFEDNIAPIVKISTSANGTSPQTFTCGSSVFSLDNLWFNTCTLTGLNPSTHYYFAVGGVDAAGNHALSQFSAAFPTPFSFTTTGSSQDFTIAAVPNTVTIQAGTQGTTSIVTTVSGGFNNSVAISLVSLQPGITATFSPNPISAPGSGTSVMTITVGGSVSVGTYFLGVSGAGGSIHHSTEVIVNVTNNTGTFSITSFPSSITVQQGNQGTSTITTVALQGFNNDITLSAPNPPTGVTVAFGTNPIVAPGSGSSLATFTVANNATIGTYTIAILGTGGGIQQGTTVTLTITPSSCTIIINPIVLPNGVVGRGYTAQLTAQCGTPPYTFTVQ